MQEWRDILTRQRAERDALDAKQEQEREAHYRKHKPVFDTLTPEER